MQVNAQVARQGLSYKWLVAIVVILGAFMSVLDQTVVNIAIPRLQNAFGADIHSVQWVVTAYLLTQGAMTPTAPYLANNVGIKRSFILSLIAFTLGSLLYAFSETTTAGWGSVKVLGFLFSGTLSLIAFIAIEITTAHRGGQPLLDLRLFTNRSFAAGNIALVFVIFGLFGSFFLIPIYLQ